MEKLTYILANYLELNSTEKQIRQITNEEEREEKAGDKQREEV